MIDFKGIENDITTGPYPDNVKDQVTVLVKIIEQQQQAIEQSLRHFDHGERLDGLWVLKQTLEGNTP